MWIGILALSSCAAFDDAAEHAYLLKAKNNGGTALVCFSVTAPEDVKGDYCVGYLATPVIPPEGSGR